MLRIISALFILSSFAVFPFAQPAAPAPINFGPIVTSYLINLTEELNELEFQLEHQEISRAEYTRSKQRLLLQKQFVEKHATETNEDSIAELQILTADELTTMLGVPDKKSQNLRVGDTVAGRWRVYGIEKRTEKFFILERDPQAIVRDPRPKPHPTEVIEIISVYEPDAEDIRRAQTAAAAAAQQAAQQEAARYTQNPAPPAAPIPRPQIRALYLPQYTVKAREKKIEGKVILSALFTRDGKLKDIILEQKLGYGLDETAIDAAKRLGFEPAKVNGQAIDMRANIIYTFTLANTMATIQPFAQPEKSAAKGDQK